MINNEFKFLMMFSNVKLKILIYSIKNVKLSQFQQKGYHKKLGWLLGKAWKEKKII